ncbi:hypothetical protein HRbin06_00444 [archaeon HR06]|nr:hypothetical protein HRbin06_00444 [archaeon HR06]
MGKLKGNLLQTLIELLLLGAHNSYIEISTKDLGKRINRSQQLASKHLLILEELEMVDRYRKKNKSYVRITEKGLKEIYDLYSSLRSIFETPRVIELRGKLFSGLGEGAYYVSLKGYREQFKNKLGFDPYPGTLNVKLLDPIYKRIRRELMYVNSIIIEGFQDELRTYGWVKCLLAELNNKIKGAVLTAFERTHYDESVIEFIAPVNVREALKLKDGDEVEIKIFPFLKF